MRYPKTSMMWAVAGLVLCGITSASGNFGERLCNSPAHDAGTGVKGALVYWDCPEALKQSLRIVSALNAGLDAFWRVEGRIPHSSEEFLSSPYFFLSRDDLLNGYQNRRARILEMTHERMRGLVESQGEEAKAVRGDIAFTTGKTRRGERSAAFYVFVQGFTGREHRVEYHGGLTTGGAPGVGSMREQYEKEKEEGWYAGLTEDDKTVYSACHYLWNSLGVTTALVRFSSRVSLAVKSDPRYDPLVSRIRNPFTGEMMREVQEPSPGNYIMFRGPPLGVQPLCFGSDGRIIKPIRMFYEFLAESERARMQAGLAPDPHLNLPPGM
ncbi:MAG: hypothetical protein V2G42_06935 [bacterium JZ-2024 1]